MNLKRDKFLYEYMGNKWWVYDPSSKGITKKNPDFSTWKWFGVLWEWAKEQEWWEDDLWNYLLDDYDVRRSSPLFEGFIDPDTFADALYAFLINK